MYKNNILIMTQKADSIQKKKSNSKSSAKNDKANNNLNELDLLYQFMNKFRNETKSKTGKNIPWTHNIMASPFGNFDIPEEFYVKFKKLYENAVVAGHNPHVTERHKEYGPIVIDFDFVHDNEHSGRYYTERTITNIIKLYNKVIKKYLEVYTLDAYVCEKKASSLRKGEYHDGIHIMYPYICTRPSLQMLIREDFIKLAEKKKIFKKMHLVNDLENVVDKAVIYQSGWLMYGSSKNKESHVYKVTHIYHTANDKIYDTILPGDKLNSRQDIKHFVDCLSCRRFFGEDSLTPLADNIDPVDVDRKINNLKNNLGEGKYKNEDLAALLGNNNDYIKAAPEETYVEAKNLVKIFSKQRSSEYHSWYQVGMCLHNIDHRLLDDWIEFSKKCKSKFRKGECEQLWKKMRSSNYTMATLHYFASKDNPVEYLRMKEEKLCKLIKEGLEASHNRIAKVLMEKYKFVYKCASIKHNIWYEFKNHKWIEIDSAYSLRNLISNELTVEYGKRQTYLYDLAKDKQGYEKEQCINEAVQIAKVIKQLNNSTFKNGVIRECCDLAYDPNFLKNLDENMYLICFDNGVYDLEADTFRDGCPDDYISLCTNYKYIKHDKNDEYYKQVEDFLEKIQPDKEMRDYLLTLLSTCLAGSVSEESFYVFTGSGANGKSKLMELMKYTLGDLFKPMDIMVLVGKRTGSSSATPEIADKKGIRICPFDEPKATDEINTGFMKIFTGGDVITARALFREPIYFKPQFKPFLLCNHLPNIKSDDDGTWRRLKVIPFLSKFIKPNDVSKKMKKAGLEKNQFWADRLLSEKLPEWKQMFMSLLIKYYQKFRVHGIIHPKLVTQYTKDYRNKCDVFQDFIGDYLERTDDIKHSIIIMNLHEGMRSWHRANYDGKCPNTKELRNYIVQRMTNSYNKKTDALTGFKLKSMENDDFNIVDLETV